MSSRNSIRFSSSEFGPKLLDNSPQNMFSVWVMRYIMKFHWGWSSKLLMARLGIVRSDEFLMCFRTLLVQLAGQVKASVDTFGELPPGSNFLNQLERFLHDLFPLLKYNIHFHCSTTVLIIKMTSTWNLYVLLLSLICLTPNVENTLKDHHHQPAPRTSKPSTETTLTNHPRRTGETRI